MDWWKEPGANPTANIPGILKFWTNFTWSPSRHPTQTSWSARLNTNLKNPGDVENLSQNLSRNSANSAKRIGCEFRRYLTRRHSSSQKLYSNDSSVDKAKSGHKIKKIYIVWRIKKIKPVLEVKWTVFKVTKRRTVSAPLYPPLNSIISSQIWRFNSNISIIRRPSNPSTASNSRGQTNQDQFRLQEGI